MTERRQLWGKRTEERIGVMLHYDASLSDRGAVEWLLHDRRCAVSYNALVLDTGEVVEIAPMDARAWHAGVCSPSAGLMYHDANSAFYGLAIAATDGDVATAAQVASILHRCEELVALIPRWREYGWWIVGHETEAWPRGRKHDPTGSDPARPVLDVSDIRKRVRAAPWGGQLK